MPSEELIAKDETYEVEFKSTARWNLREERKDKRMEDAVVKTIAGFLNTDGGTLFIGVGDDASDRRLGPRLAARQAAERRWLRQLADDPSHQCPQAHRRDAHARSDRPGGRREVCRIDVARSSAPVMARMSDGREAFWVRMNNSTRELPEIEVEEYVKDHWKSGVSARA